MKITRFYCDKCGREFKHKVYQGFFWKAFNVYGTRYDLCPRCAKLHDQWMNEEKVLVDDIKL